MRRRSFAMAAQRPCVWFSSRARFKERAVATYPRSAPPSGSWRLASLRRPWAYASSRRRRSFPAVSIRDAGTRGGAGGAYLQKVGDVCVDLGNVLDALVQHCYGLRRLERLLKADVSVGSAAQLPRSSTHQHGRVVFPGQLHDGGDEGCGDGARLSDGTIT